MLAVVRELGGRWFSWAFAVDGAGSSFVVVLRWHRLVGVVSWSSHVVVPSAWCPGHIIVACCCRHAPSSPRHPASSLHLAVRSSSCRVVVMLLLSSWLTSARRHLCPFVVVLCLSKVGWDERGVLTMVSKIEKQRRTTTLVIVRRLVATSRTATWHLDFVLMNSLVRRGDFTHLG